MTPEEHLRRVFPGLRQDSFTITSRQNPRYNCIAWAGGDERHFWWPAQTTDAYWPPGVPAEESVEAFQQAFGTLGYAPCDRRELESDFEKVAIFVDARGIPTHAARQLPDGYWTSKLGKQWDIRHTLEELEGQLYGRVGLLLKRPVQTQTAAVPPVANSEPDGTPFKTKEK